MQGYRLDPQDWDRFGQEMHKLLDACLDRMAGYRDLPWQPPGQMDIGLGKASERQPEGTVFDVMAQTIMPTATGNTHPAFWGWVHGGGIPASIGAELVAATMNSNCGGRDHGAAHVEAEVIRWLCATAGMARDAFGVMTTGTSQATILALMAARVRRFGEGVRETGIRDLPPVAVYASDGAHACIAQALEVMGHGRAALRGIATDARGAMQLEALQDAIDKDRAEGVEPLAIVGTAGSVGVGAFDDLTGVADLAGSEGIWLHIDAAFGFWTRLADNPWHALSDGIRRADSIALDAHKWPGVQYDCGACLIADRDLHRATFASRPAYLESAAEGLAGGDTWFTDYGLELSRGFRALKLWAAIQTCGTRALGAAITDNCRQAALMGEMVEGSPVLKLAHPVISNVCCFAVEKGDVSRIAADLQLAGQAVFSTITLNGTPCLRAAIVNHRTTEDDLRRAIAAVEATQH
ncbi:pyridoxal phosphate-dependent decarboxylase family protein [Salibaculum griseiflavum]|nr:pyridoxal-dependent decarboxylase [Salibaculum griseiflavum]